MSEAAPRSNDAFDFMNVLHQRGLHDLHDERWNAYGQATWIGSYKPAFHANYTNLNGSTQSLLPTAESSFTGSATLYLAARLWKGAELYWVPEVIAERPLSHLAGLGSTIQNFELQKTGAPSASAYSSRLFLRQTISLGGKDEEKTSDPQQLATTETSRRLVFTVGNFSILDLLDKNSFSGDLRRQFLNMAFLSYAAYDFAADARGYAWGGVAELYWDKFTVRVGRVTAPKLPNQLDVDFRLDKVYGDQLEVEHNHTLFGKAGAVRVLGYSNNENMGSFEEATTLHAADRTKNATTCTSFSYGSNNSSAPDLCFVRRMQNKVGIGLNVEQHVTDDIGVFLRAMYSDGRTEVYSYTSTDRSFSFGVLAHGSLWHRPLDITGVGMGVGLISDSHAAYLKQGGVDGFIGDGNINVAPESVNEVFYSVNVSSNAWVTGDYQRITNPAYNADRGPVDIFGARFHAEF